LSRSTYLLPSGLGQLVVEKPSGYVCIGTSHIPKGQTLWLKMAYIMGWDTQAIDNLHFHGTNVFSPKSIGQTTGPITLGSAWSSNHPLYIWVANEVISSSPWLWACFHPLSPLSVQSNEILLNLSMKCLNWAFDAESWRVIIVVVQVGAVSALRKKESHDETVGKASLGPSYFALYNFHSQF
jgi:hypothetical protein